MQDEVEKILDAFQGQTIIIDNKGSVLGPEEDMRAFKASKDSAKSAINRLLVEARIKELEKAHRANGTGDADNPTDEYIDERIAELKKQLGEK